MAATKWSYQRWGVAALWEKGWPYNTYGWGGFGRSSLFRMDRRPHAKSSAITEDQMTFLSDLLSSHEPAYTNFEAMSPSVKKTYTRAYFSAKTEAGKLSRLTWMVDSLNKNLKPM